ncbi:hypothetical protein NQ036_03580 [Brevibacterium sp. 91QC2O2]|uniref:hypothetical protein n=1 Tax=Brevibacterium TaxID=1696 RepID=UPI00211C745D|nr:MULTISPECIES: hypothetical protein [unclassified Brevibacterium]MCQ9367327.1 hypothetical protein [Brevibacterium sp. 91QC2O2]MCQ9384660.1 hypothetical protein [Brevibacterium sp. 68QC2CO]
MAEGPDFTDMDDTQLELARLEVERQQLIRTNRKAVARELKRATEDLATQYPDVFAEEFTAEGVEGCPLCVHVPIGEPAADDPHLQYKKQNAG